uniref:Nucleotide-binding alpha-beta plait domain-containing protein n=1 Tax=Tanacetum cinerariifolium TaxID=118510 RepID=A0A699H0J4_TANCI|nr:nucleotide-binding alpha-beta plait domain-containing protein [Tanacetum cinerariifolium]
MKMIWDNQIDGRIQPDPDRLIADFLKISNHFHYEKKKKKKKHAPFKNQVNYFFANFPSDMREVNLHDLFSKCGEIVDVYVARKLGVDIAKFERSSFKSGQGERKDARMFDMPFRLNQTNMVSLFASTNQPKWLQNVLIGEANSIDSLLELQSIFQAFEVTYYIVKYLGGFKNMLKFNEKEDASYFLLNTGDQVACESHRNLVGDVTYDLLSQADVVIGPINGSSDVNAKNTKSPFSLYMGLGLKFKFEFGLGFGFEFMISLVCRWVYD